MSRIIPLLLIAILTFSVSAPAAQVPPDQAFQKRIATDAKYFTIIRANLQRAAAFAHSRPDLFGPAGERDRELITHEEKLVVWRTWSSVLDSIAGLDSLRREHKKFDLFQEGEA